MILQNKTVGTSAKRPTAKLKHHWQFNRSSLPMPIVALQRLGIKPGKANRGGFWILPCPFHKDGKEKNPSLHLQQVEGYYRCHACGAKGGDVLALYRAITGKSFRDAARELGAWKEGL
jgi:DNA primase